MLEEMRVPASHLGGQQSGHLIFADHATTGDGILTAVKFLTLWLRRRSGRWPTWPRRCAATPRCW